MKPIEAMIKHIVWDYDDNTELSNDLIKLIKNGYLEFINNVQISKADTLSKYKQIHFGHI